MCSPVWTLIDSGKIANQIARLVAIVVKIALVEKKRGVAVSLRRRYIYIRLEVQFLCYIITRNESFNRNFPLSYKAKIEMLQMPHFVTMHRILADILPPYLH